MTGEASRNGPSLTGDYARNPTGWVRSQLEKIEETGTTRSVHIMNRPVVVVTMRGKQSGLLRKVPLMRVERDGVYAIVASKGGAPRHPQWYANLKANPDVVLQDDEETYAVRARELQGAERDEWWAACVEAYPPYAEYQERTDRLIPVFVLEPR
jgi:F420H(2)-dependent quinone reductase